MGDVRFRWLVVAAGAWLASGCTGGVATMPPAGRATVMAVPKTLSSADPVVTSASMSLEPIAIYGDAPPPPAGAVPPSIQLDLLGQGSAVELDGLRPGLYSGVQLDFHNVMLEGTWQGTPFTLQPERSGAPINLRASSAQELGPGKDITFVLSVDPSGWFADGLLDSAVVADGAILCDSHDNPEVAAQLAARIQASLTLP